MDVILFPRSNSYDPGSTSDEEKARFPALVESFRTRAQAKIVKDVSLNSEQDPLTDVSPIGGLGWAAWQYDGIL